VDVLFPGRKQLASISFSNTVEIRSSYMLWLTIDHLQSTK
jgi:hypothetical protein